MWFRTWENEMYHAPTFLIRLLCAQLTQLNPAESRVRSKAGSSNNEHLSAAVFQTAVTDSLKQHAVNNDVFRLYLQIRTTTRRDHVHPHDWTKSSL